MDTFEVCREVNRLVASGDETAARDALILLLEERGDWSQDLYGSLINHMIRATGLYPYINPVSATWSDRFVYEAFKVDVGGGLVATLHREQSILLRRLLDGEDLAISAPTSFGKSFIIDAFIAIKRPRNVVVIVPTLALTDETRRRLHRKFGRTYKVITTTGVPLAERNILVFPQERVQGYLDQLDVIDLLVVDEFYKASPTYDKERSPSLLRAILQLKGRARQRYFLAPNISAVNESPFTSGMQFQRLDFNTVYLERHYLYQEIGKDSLKKAEALLGILRNTSGKTLVYAGTYSGIDKVAALLIAQRAPMGNDLLDGFSGWLSRNYDPSWSLANLVKRAVGVHNGRLHRALSQIQVKLFDDPNGLDTLVTTSSIVEGVNTSAENVVLWSNKKGQPRLDDFTYKNIIGRGGRMFRHFVGKIYVLERPPEETEAQLDLELPDQLLGGLDEDLHRGDLTDRQLAKIVENRNELEGLVGRDVAARLEQATFQTSDWNLIRLIVQAMKVSPEEWSGLRALNGLPIYWDHMLYKVINLMPGRWDAAYSKFVAFVKILSDNWTCAIPELLSKLEEHDLGVEEFFQLERNATFKLAALFNDVAVVAREVLEDPGLDISYFIGRLSNAFLPPLVYQLEEYGLPRMIARKMHASGLLDMTRHDLALHDAIEFLARLGRDGIAASVPSLDDFDRYMVEAFLEGISIDELLPQA